MHKENDFLGKKIFFFFTMVKKKYFFFRPREKQFPSIFFFFYFFETNFIRWGQTPRSSTYFPANWRKEGLGEVQDRRRVEESAASPRFPSDVFCV
jgi:hypothetical protein